MRSTRRGGGRQPPSGTGPHRRAHLPIRSATAARNHPAQSSTTAEPELSQYRNQTQRNQRTTTNHRPEPNREASSMSIGEIIATGELFNVLELTTATPEIASAQTDPAN